MKIFYQKGHEGDGEWIEDECKKEVIKNISIAELISRMKSFLDEHPNAYIQSESQLNLLEWDKDKKFGFSVDFYAEGDETD